MGTALLTALIAVAALLPFERLGGFDVGGLNVRPSQVALAAAWLLSFRAFLRGRGTTAWREPWFLALAGFFAAAALSLVHAENVGRSVLMLGFAGFTASLAFLLPETLKPEHLPRVRTAILVSAAAVGLFGIWQFVGDMLGAPAWLTGIRDTYARGVLGFTRVASTAAEPLYFANYLLLPIALAAAWLLRKPDARMSRLLTALLALLVLNVFLTSSRGGWLSLGVTGLALLWLERARLRDVRPLLTAAAAGLTAVAIGVVLLGRFFSPTSSGIAETFFRHVTTVTDGAAFDDRAATFRAALDAWRAHPWIGIGFGGYGPRVAPFAFEAPASGWPIANNQTLELLAETGLVGLAAFVLFLALLFRRARTPVPGDADALRTACLAALCGMLVQYQTFSTLHVMHIWFTMGLLLSSSQRADA